MTDCENWSLHSWEFTVHSSAFFFPHYLLFDKNENRALPLQTYKLHLPLFGRGNDTSTDTMCSSRPDVASERLQSHLECLSVSRLTPSLKLHPPPNPTPPQSPARQPTMTLTIYYKNTLFSVRRLFCSLKG